LTNEFVNGSKGACVHVVMKGMSGRIS